MSIKSSPVAELLRLARTGNKEALSELSERIRIIAREHFKQKFTDKNILDCIVQDAVVWLVENLDKVKKGESIKAFMTSKMIFMFADYFRRKYGDIIEYRDSSLISTQPEFAEEDEQIEKFELKDEFDNQWKTVRPHIEKLRPEYKEAIFLHYAHGLEYQVMAERMNISFAAAKKRTVRALSCLRRNLKNVSLLLCLILFSCFW